MRAPRRARPTPASCAADRPGLAARRRGAADAHPPRYRRARRQAGHCRNSPPQTLQESVDDRSLSPTRRTWLTDCGRSFCVRVKLSQEQRCGRGSCEVIGRVTFRRLREVWRSCGGSGHRRAVHRVQKKRKDREMPQGTVKWFNAKKGFGFIAPEDGSADVFVHYTEIQGSGFRTLEENQRVEFEVGQSPKGPQATGVRSV